MQRGRQPQAARRDTRCTGAGVCNGAIMSTFEYIYYRGIMVPPLAHTEESLEYAQNFSVEDTDVFAVTYPKSGIKQYLSSSIYVLFIIIFFTIQFAL